MMKYLFLLLTLFTPFLLHAQGGAGDVVDDQLSAATLPTAFNYTALIYQEGKPVAEKTVKLLVKLQDPAGQVLYSEQISAKTTKAGLVNVTVGAGQGSVQQGSMETVPWEKGLRVAAEVDIAANGTFVSLGDPVPMQAVPYALYANSVSLIKGTKKGKEAGESIFQVQNSEGAPLFSVYEDAVTINVPVTEETRRPRGGFAVRSFRRSMRAEEPSYQLTDRFTIGGGNVNVFIDPEGETTRRPRGGFAVMTRNRFRGEEPSTLSQHKLFQVGEKETYFTIDKCEVESTFQFRDRTEPQKIVANITKEGAIETLHKPEDVVVKPRPVQRAGDYNLSWPWMNMFYPKGMDRIGEFGFTNLMRWRYPLISSGKEVLKISEIEILNDPTDSRKLSDYLQVTDPLVWGPTVDPTKAVALKPTLQLTSSFVFPKGKLRITAVGKDIQPVVIDYTIPENLKMLSQDRLSLKLGLGVGTVESNSFDLLIEPELSPDSERLITPHLSFGALASQSDIECEVVGAAADFLQLQLSPNVETEHAERKLGELRVTDREKFKEAVGEFSSGIETKHLRVKIKVKFPNGVFQDIETEGDIWVQK